MGRCSMLDLRRIFQSAVNSVHPATIFSSGTCLERSKQPNGHETLRVCNTTAISLTAKKCHLVGFGKAVLGMAVQTERILGERLVSGVISIPIGTIEKFKGVENMTLNQNSVVKVFEGAENNLPDENAMNGANEILNLVASMTNDDILFVLVSGGGSALLPLPVDPITLEEKTHMIRTLAAKGADIEELNIVRIAISQTKGGKLANKARNAYKIFSLIISDIVNDPLHLIASGPTVQFENDGRTAQFILEKYDEWNKLDHKIKTVIHQNQNSAIHMPKNNFVYLIGTNRIAANAAQHCSQELGYKSCILSTAINGSLIDLVRQYTELLINLQNYIQHRCSEKEFALKYPFGTQSFRELIATIESSVPGDSLCLVFAGEPTAVVKGNGKGGRNQELALRMSMALYQNEPLEKISFLSAGTDGIDGPTHAAGAIGGAEIVKDYLKNKPLAEVQNFIDRNDSYNFYANLNGGKHHITTGHTGTNVMDIHLFVIPVDVLSKL